MAENQFKCPTCGERGCVESGPDPIEDKPGVYEIELECTGDDCARMFWAEVQFVRVIPLDED